MELNEKLQTEIADIFRKVTWGEITFKLSPENRTLDYSVKTTGKLAIDEKLNKPGYVLTKNRKLA